MLGFLFGALILAIIGALLVAPIASMILCLQMRRQQTEMANDLIAIQEQLHALAKTQASKPGEATQQPLQEKTTLVTAPVLLPPAPESPSATPDRSTYKITPIPPPPPASAFHAKQELQEQPATYVDPEHAEPGHFEAAARRILTKIWNWIVVGEEFRRPGISTEYAVATNWLVRIGVVIVVIGVLFFLDYTSTRGWLGPMGKVAISLLTGSALLTVGIRLLGRRYHLIGQGLLGAGLAVWYAGLFAAANLYGLIGTGSAFILMACVTVGAGFMAVRFNSLLVAILGLIGGYGTPLMLSADSVNFPGL